MRTDYGLAVLEENIPPFGFRLRRYLNKRISLSAILEAGCCASSAISAIIASNENH